MATISRSIVNSLRKAHCCVSSSGTPAPYAIRFGPCPRHCLALHLCGSQFTPPRKTAPRHRSGFDFTGKSSPFQLFIEVNSTNNLHPLKAEPRFGYVPCHPELGFCDPMIMSIYRPSALFISDSNFALLLHMSDSIFLPLRSIVGVAVAPIFLVSARSKLILSLTA